MTTYLNSASFGKLISALEAASPNRHSTSLAAHVVQHVEQVIDVEADVQRISLVADLDRLLGLFLLGVGGDDLQAAVGQHPAHAAEFLVRQDRGAHQRLAQRFAPDRKLVLVPHRNDARVIGKLSVDELRHQFDAAERKGSLGRGKLDLHLVVAVGEQLAEFEHGLARHDHLLARQLGLERHRRHRPGDGRRWRSASGSCPRPPSAGRSGSSGCPAAPSRTAPGRAAGAMPSATARSGRDSPAGLRQARKILRRQRLQRETALAGLDEQAACPAAASVTSAPSGSARRISTSLRAPTVTECASPADSTAALEVICISMSVARNESVPVPRSIRTLERIGRVWRRSMIPLTAESGPSSSSRFALTRTIVVPSFLYL